MQTIILSICTLNCNGLLACFAYFSDCFTLNFSCLTCHFVSNLLENISSGISYPINSLKLGYMACVVLISPWHLIVLHDPMHHVPGAGPF
jgi:hypothetical protein